MHPGDQNANIDLTLIAVKHTGLNIPKDFSISQNYPNPFNSSTIIDYTLPSESNVRIIIYNLIGQQVSELVNQNQTAGYHEVNFNADNLSSGVYFYKIIALAKNNSKKFILTKKMILLE